MHADQPNSTTTSAPLRVKTTALNRAMEYFRAALAAQPKAFITLCKTVDTSLVATHPLALGTLISFLSDPNSITNFRIWAQHCLEAEALAELGEALAELALPADLSPLSHSKPGREHFFGKLNESYLMALLVERTPSAAIDPQSKVPLLRAWLFLHAFLRNQRDIRLDENLQIVARALRIGCDRDEGWLLLFFQLLDSPSAHSFRELNYRLGSRARQLLATSDMPDKEHKALRAVSDISSHRDKQLNHPSYLPPLIANHEAISEPPSPEVSTIEAIGHNAETYFDTETSTTLVIETPPPAYTPSQRKLSTRTVLLASSEGMQFLPWSWHRPNPIESRRIQEWIGNKLTTNQPASPDALVTAFMWIAIALGRNATRMLALRIANTVEAEWQFSPEHRVFKRHPPMRLPGWLPDDAAHSWTDPVASEISAHPPEAVQQILCEALRRSPEACTLRQLWPAGNTLAPEQAINAALVEISPRLTGGMLGEALPQRVFEYYQDAVLARLIACHPQSPLSGAHSYAHWRLDTVTKLLSGKHDANAPSNSSPIALGSRLEVSDQIIRREIRKSHAAIVKAKVSGNPISIHNAYTAYIVLALLAATGARPVRSPFESLKHFDFLAELLFIDDKRTGSQERTGRVVPLVSGFSAFLQKRYLPHLRVLAELLANTNYALSQSITRTAAQGINEEMPLFFFIDEKGGWLEITPISLFRYAAIDWPLPANLFRHRLSNRLRSLGLDSEIIDGLLGHDEWGSETWGYLSFRSWKQDAELARRTLDKAFRVLRFYPMHGLTDSLVPTENFDHSPSRASARLFGSEARHRERKRRHFATLREAAFVIREFLQDRELASLDADELDKLADRLTKTETGMPIPSGGLRLSLLIRKLERIEVQSGKRHRPKRERLQANPPPSMFSERAPGAEHTVAKILGKLEQLSPSNRAAQRIAGIVSLSVESRISDPVLLLDVAAGKKNRLVRYGHRYYIEYGLIDGDNEIAGRRFNISERAAEWLHQSRDLGPIKPTDSLPRSLLTLFKYLPIVEGNLAAYLTSLAEVIDQANALSLPGIICGLLAGRTESTALGWRDTVRLHCARKIDLAHLRIKLETDLPLKFSGNFVTAENADQRREANHNLLAEVHEGLLGADKTRRGTPNLRRTMRASLSNAIRKGVDQFASPTLLLLAQWILHLASDERSRVLQPVSLRRYWTALAWRFNSELCDFDLLHCDEDEITEAYSRVLLASDKPASSYTLERLSDFHLWLIRTFDVETPRWEELPLVHPGLGVSPGFITPDEYLEAFERLLSITTHDAETALDVALLLLLAYRFGLRRSEGLYLLRKDWENNGDHVVVTVCSNRWRRLKSEASRRQIPLVFSLTSREKDAITKVLALYASRHGDDHSQPLLSYVSERPIMTEIQRVLQEVTGNPRITLHHARHSAANLVALAVTGLCPSNWNWPEVDHEAGIQLLGCKTQASRRHAWAIARFLGHASPTTSCKSYLHFLFDWAENLLNIPTNNRSQICLKGIPNLDQLPEVAALSNSMQAGTTNRATIQTVLQAYRLHGRQVSPEAIAFTVSHPESEVEHWLSLLEAREGNGKVLTIVTTLSDTTWNRLIAWSTSLRLPQPPEEAHLSNDELNEMLGKTRQLLAWRREHFALLRVVIQTLGLSENNYQMYGSAQLHEGTRSLAKEYDFFISDRPLIHGLKTNTSGRRIQIDTALCGPHLEPVASRCALIFKENNALPIRNQLQFSLITLIIGLILNTPFTPSEEQNHPSIQNQI